MLGEIERAQESYYEREKRPCTWSGLPLKVYYGPEDTHPIEYHRDIGNPGEYPYTRGIHPDMFRGRYWTRREVTGYGTPEDTNGRLKFLIQEGMGGLNIIPDNPTVFGLDPDHPRADGEVGVQGVSLCSIEDMKDLMQGIPIDKMSISLIFSSTQTPVSLAQYIALAQDRGLDISKLSGTTQNDAVHLRFCGFRLSNPIDLALKTAVDVIEFCSRYMPKWYPINVNLYDLREHGITAPQEIAFGFSMALLYIQKTLERGLNIDDFAPRFAFYCSAHIDFFEEIAKLRAARRLWAKIMKERFGAKDPRSMKFKFGVHTAGCSLVPQQPLNNAIRVAYEALVAVLSGVQSLHCCSYDEPVALPTEGAVRLALRTQQILAYETGVAKVSDPLGGSYYIEDLTNRIEEEAVRIMDEIESIGGMKRALETEWIDRKMEEAALQYQKEVERGERVIVGLNAFRIEEESTPGGVHRVPCDAQERQIARLKAHKERRNEAKVKKAILELKRRAEVSEKENLIPFMVDAARAGATLSEVLGTLRVVMGYTYDPFDVVSNPFF